MNEVTQTVAALADSSVGVRQRAAGELYRQGVALGDSVVNDWKRNPALAALLVGSPTVGIAVRPETFRRIHAAWGRPRLANVPAEHDADEFELHFGEASLDIITTRTGHGAIAGFLDKHGEGIQQVEYPTTDVDAATDLLRAAGVSALYPQSRLGADHTRVNFFLAATPHGEKVLIEFVQAP